MNHDCNHLMSGVIIEANSKTPINRIQINLYSSDNVLLKKAFSDRTGRFDFGPLNCNKVFVIKVLDKSYQSVEVNFIIPSDKEFYEQRIALKPL